MVVGELGLGGAERQAILLAGHLAKDPQNEVELLALTRGSGSAIALCDEYRVPWKIVSSGRGPLSRARTASRLAWMLRSSKPDVIVPFTMFPNVVCGSIWKLTGAKSCVWNQADGGLHRMGKWLERFAVAQTPAFVSNSQHGAQFLIDEFGVARERIAVISNGVALASPKESRASWRKFLAAEQDSVVACMVGNLTQLKDHVTLLNAWRLVADRLHEKGRDCMLVLAGEEKGATGTALKSLANALGIAGSVRFLGHVDDVGGLLRAVDIGVFSSRSEGSPNGVLECMAAALPVAGTDIPGIRETVGPSGGVFLAPAGNAEALAEKIIELAENTELRAQLGRANAERINADFAPGSMVKRVTDLIADVSRC